MLSRNGAPAIPYFEVDRLHKEGLTWNEIARHLEREYSHRWWSQSLREAWERGPRKRPAVEIRLLRNAIESAVYFHGDRKGFWKYVAREMGYLVQSRHFWTSNAARIAAIKYNMVPEGISSCRKILTNHSS